MQDNNKKSDTPESNSLPGPSFDAKPFASKTVITGAGPYLALAGGVCLDFSQWLSLG